MDEDTSFMDWTPTKLPPFNPYPENYIPGGWPLSPSPPTSQTFARPPPPGFFLPTAKRVCRNLGVVGGFAYSLSSAFASGATKATFTAGSGVAEYMYRRPIVAIVRQFQRERPRQPSRQTGPPSPSAWNRAVAASRRSVRDHTQKQTPSTPEPIRTRPILPPNTPHPAALRSALKRPRPQEEKEASNIHHKVGRKFARSVNRVHFLTPKTEQRLAAQLGEIEPFANMPRFSPPKDSEPRLVATPTHAGHQTPAACDRLVSPFPALRPHGAITHAQTPPPQGSPANQLFGELRTAANEDDASDVSSDVSGTWQPLRYRLAQCASNSPKTAQTPFPSPSAHSDMGAVPDPESPSPKMTVKEPEAVPKATDADQTNQPLTPPPIHPRPYVAASPESDISSTFDYIPGSTPQFQPGYLINLNKNNTEANVAPSRQPISSDSVDQQNVLNPTSDGPKTDSQTPRLHGFDTQTPEQKLRQLAAELRIDDPRTPEPATPKAGRHSSEKKTRLTRTQAKKLEAEKDHLKYEIVPLTAEWEAKVGEAVRKGHGKLTASDYARVVPPRQGGMTDNWLNDEVINGYLQLVVEHGKQNDRKGQVPTYHAFTSFFYNNLESKGYDGVRRWASRAKVGGKNLLQTEQVFIPINSGLHWTLCVVSGTQKKITHYNSLSGRGRKYIEVVKTWVQGELGSSYNEDEWTFDESGESPKQQNSDDCGVFTITSARQIMLGLSPTSYKPEQISTQRKRIVAELVNGGLIKSRQ